MDIDPKDKKYLKDVAEPGFSPARNAWVIEDTIRKTDQMIEMKKKAWEAGFAERVEVARSFFAFKGNGASKTLDEYLGPKEMNNLWGERLTEKIKKASMNKNKWITL